MIEVTLPTWVKFEVFLLFLKYLEVEEFGFLKWNYNKA